MRFHVAESVPDSESLMSVWDRLTYVFWKRRSLCNEGMDEMRAFLIMLFVAILIGMLYVTTVAALDRSILKVGPEILGDRWFQATLADAYFGFITFYAWVAYKETTWAGKVVWFLLVMLLGNIAMSIYVLLQLWRLKKDKPVYSMLLRPEHVPQVEI